MLDKNFKNEKTKMESQVSNEKDSTNDTDDLFKYDEYVEVKRPKITKKKKANQKKSKNDKNDRIANVPVKEDKDAAIVYYSDELTVVDLAERLGKSTGEIVKQLLMLGMMATVNQTLDRETVELLAEEAGFEVTDHIKVGYEGAAKIEEVFNEKGDFIAGETLCDGILKGATGSYVKDWNINGEDVKLSVEKI